MTNEKKPKRNFVLMDGGKDTTHVFTGRAPRQAACKACVRGHTKIVLREKGTKKLHHFQGTIVEKPKPKGAPDWMPDIVKIPKVKKIKTEKLD